MRTESRLLLLAAKLNQWTQEGKLVWQNSDPPPQAFLSRAVVSGYAAQVQGLNVYLYQTIQTGDLGPSDEPRLFLTLYVSDEQGGQRALTGGEVLEDLWDAVSSSRSGLEQKIEALLAE